MGIKVSLLTGKTIEISSEMFFSFSDEEWQREMQDLVAFDLGNPEELDPFSDSVISHLKKTMPSEDIADLKALDESTFEDKLESLDTSEMD